MREERKTIFLTGATGFLGSYLALLFLKNGDKVIALARSAKDKTARERTIDLLRFWDDSFSAGLLDRLSVIEGDIVNPGFGVKQVEDLRIAAEATDIIVHSAALAEIRSPIEKTRPINVGGAKNVLDFALSCPNLKKFNHISTAYVIGNKQDIEFSEDMLDVGQKFHNTYEQTKFEAEVLVNEYRGKGLDISIFRPSMVMGALRDGRINSFRLFYGPLHFFARGICEEFPIDLASAQNLINIESVGRGLFLLADEPGPLVFHLVSSEPVRVSRLLNMAGEYFGYKPPRLIAPDKFDFSKWTPVQRVLSQPFLPYFNSRSRFASRKTAAILAKKGFAFPEIDDANLLRIFEYCHKTGFIRRNPAAIQKSHMTNK